jgi:5-formyltetrahydrofolate cyclo-ligase
MKKKRDALSKKERSWLSAKIEKKLFSLGRFKAAKTVMFYVTHRSEADTSKMIRSSLRIGKNVVVPKVDPGKNGKMLAVKITCLEKDLERGMYGIFEPKLERCEVLGRKSIDLVIVPGLAFDLKGFRVGYGKGYYDRWLKSFSLKKRIGLAFDFQLLKSVPKDRRDMRVGLIVTEKRTLKMS